MALDLKKLERLVELADGVKRSRCPACAANGQDKKGEHLRIAVDGRFGCCVFPGDRDHRKQIFALAGERGHRAIKVRVAPAKPTGPMQSGILGRLGHLFSSQAKHPAAPDALDGVGEVQTHIEGIRTPRTGLSDSNHDTALGDPLPNNEIRTPRTPVEYSRVYKEKIPSVEGNHVYTLRESREGVRGVRQVEGVEQTPETAEKQGRLPHFTPGGTLVIPFDSPERYHWWRGGQSVALTIAELKGPTVTPLVSEESSKNINYAN
jgi:hypothetical protein